MWNTMTLNFTFWFFICMKTYHEKHLVLRRQPPSLHTADTKWNTAIPLKCLDPHSVSHESLLLLWYSIWVSIFSLCLVFHFRLYLIKNMALGYRSVIWMWFKNSKSRRQHTSTRNTCLCTDPRVSGCGRQRFDEHLNLAVQLPSNSHSISEIKVIFSSVISNQMQNTFHCDFWTVFP